MNNNKGFTLIELLGVLVVLTLILLVAIPNIVSTFERNKNRIDEKKKEIIISATEIYVSKYKNKIDGDNDRFFSDEFYSDGGCIIKIDDIKSKNLIVAEELKNSDGSNISNVYIKYKEGKYELVYDDNLSHCLNSNYDE